ncbi:hypothetical protein [Corallococcus sp. 4LFB]|uniref:hypothetical protein n=1 Tax=Corallococcus sp. 4LFB TaxID=3383249 RepID=UPI0039755F96
MSGTRQYTGTAGKVENVQVGAFLPYATPRGHALGTGDHLGGMPPLSRLVLLEDSADHLSRTYRAVYGKDLTQRWKVTFNPAGLIAELDVTDE